MKVEVLFFAGCPGYEELLPEVRQLAVAAGAELEVRAVESLEDAEGERFLGPPTVRVDGRTSTPARRNAETSGWGAACTSKATARHTGRRPRGSGPRWSAPMSEQIGYGRLRELIADGAQLVEVLPQPEYAEAHLPGAINIPLKQLDQDSTAQLDRTKAVVVYCWDGL